MWSRDYIVCRSKPIQSFSRPFTVNSPLHLKSWYHIPANTRRDLLRISSTAETGYNARNTPQPQSASSGFQGLGGGALNKLFAKCINFALLAAMQNVIHLPCLPLCIEFRMNPSHLLCRSTSKLTIDRIRPHYLSGRRCGVQAYRHRCQRLVCREGREPGRLGIREKQRDSV